MPEKDRKIKEQNVFQKTGLHAFLPGKRMTPSPIETPPERFCSDKTPQNTPFYRRWNGQGTERKQQREGVDRTRNYLERRDNERCSQP